MVDTLGLIWARLVTGANESDTGGLRSLVLMMLPWCARLVRLYVDRGYMISLWAWIIGVSGGRCVVNWVMPSPGETRQTTGQRGFAVQPKRWIAERTLAWLNWSRRLSKDYEQTTESSQAWIDVSAIRTALRKIEPERT